MICILAALWFLAGYTTCAMFKTWQVDAVGQWMTEGRKFDDAWTLLGLLIIGFPGFILFPFTFGFHRPDWLIFKSVE